MRHFGGKALSSKWTLAFVIKKMGDLDRTKKEPKGGRKPKSLQQVTKDSFHKRRAETWNVKEALQELKENATPEIRSSVNQVLSEITSHEHIASEKCLAYRANFWSDECFMKIDKKVFQDLQSVMERVANQSTAPDGGGRRSRARKRKRNETEETHHQKTFSFVQESNLLDMPAFRSIHFDLWDMIYSESPSMSLSDTSIGGAIYEKCKRMLRRYFEGKRYEDIVDMHFHVDVQRYVPDQAKWLNDKRYCSDDATGKRKEAVDAQFRAAAASVDVSLVDAVSPVTEPCGEDLVNYDTPKSGVWSSYFKNERDRGFLVALHAVLAGKAAVDLLRSTSSSSGAQRYHSEDEYEQRMRVYVHGVAVIPTDEARDVEVKDLMFCRLDESVLVYTRGTDKRKLARKRIGPEFLMDAQSYDPNCSWSFSDKGINRFANGDSQHGEAKLRIIHSIENVTVHSFQDLRLHHAQRNVLVVSSSFESPFVNSVSQRLRGVNIYHRIGETVLVDVNKYFEALQYFKLTPEEVALVYAMAGSGCTPATQGIPAEYYFEAHISYRKEIGSLRPRIEEQGISWNLRIYPEIMWSSFEKLVAISYGLKHKRRLSLAGFKNGSENCVKALRRAVSKIPGSAPNHLMPETNDIDLQTRRAFWVLRYWRLAEGVSSDGETARGLCMEWGYDADGRPILEKPADVELRRKILKHIIKRCSCKSGCADRRCSCRKQDPPRPCLLCKCQNCKNDLQGGTAQGLSENDQMIARALASTLEAIYQENEAQILEVAADGADSSSDESSGYVSEDAMEHLQQEQRILLQADREIQNEQT